MTVIPMWERTPTATTTSAAGPRDLGSSTTYVIATRNSGNDATMPIVVILRFVSTSGGRLFQRFP
jgi:hypothetical protein